MTRFACGTLFALELGPSRALAHRPFCACAIRLREAADSTRPLCLVCTGSVELLRPTTDAIALIAASNLSICFSASLRSSRSC